MGISGSGKTTFARELARRPGVAHVELDAIFHQPNWTPLDPAEFVARVSAAAAGDGWAIDGSYDKVRPVLWALWNGNREALRNVFSRDAERIRTPEEARAVLASAGS